MRFRRSVLSGAVVVVAVLSATSAYAKREKGEPRADAPTPVDAPVAVTNVSFNGPGCPAGTATTSISPDGQVFTVIFDSFIAELNEGNAKKSKTHCQLHARVSVPKGWSYALSSVDYRGYAFLGEGVTATQQSTYQMTGAPKAASAKTVLTGAYDDDYAIHDAAFDGLLWSRCGKGDLLKIRTQMEVRSSKGAAGNGLMTVDSIDGTVTQVYQLVWRRC